MTRATALLPDDEPLLRDRLRAHLQRLWPELEVVAEARNGREAVERFDEHALKRRGLARGHLQWIRASVGTSVRLIPVDQVAFLRSDEKYTLVVWDGGEALIRKTIRELADELDPDVFVQVHRSVIVNLRRVAQVDRGLNETAELRLKDRPEVLPVSRSFLHLFRQM
jgi:DNA-binding LytR/AlgR family response regulator